jgi:predicted transcriptional regulator
MRDSERGEKIARKTRKINREIEERSRIGIVREKEEGHGIRPNH